MVTRQRENCHRFSGQDIQTSSIAPLSGKRRGVVLFNESPTVLLSSNSSIGECGDEEDYLEEEKSVGVHYGDVSFKNNYKYTLRREEFEDNKDFRRVLRPAAATGVLSTSRVQRSVAASSIEGEASGGVGVGWYDQRRHPARRGASSDDRGHGGIGIERLLLDSDQDDDQDDEVVEGVGVEGEETVADQLAMSRQPRIIGEREYRDTRDHRDIIRESRDRDISSSATTTAAAAGTGDHSTLRRQHREPDYDYEGSNNPPPPPPPPPTGAAASSAANKTVSFIYLFTLFFFQKISSVCVDEKKKQSR